MSITTKADNGLIWGTLENASEQNWLVGTENVRITGFRDHCGSLMPCYEIPEITLFEGCVLDTVTRCERVMSDVWEDIRYVRVWDAALGTVREICVGRLAHWTIDATPATLAAVAKAESDARWTQLAREIGRARGELLDCDAPRKGQMIEVIKGRKVAHGTKGVVVWIGPGFTDKYGRTSGGARLGIVPCDIYGQALSLLQTEGKSELVYTAASNVRVIDHRDLLALARSYAPARKPVEMGAKVSVTSGRDKGAEGIVFWVKGARLGVRTSSRKVAGRYVDVAWVNASQVVVA